MKKSAKIIIAILIVIIGLAVIFIAVNNKNDSMDDNISSQTQI